MEDLIQRLNQLMKEAAELLKRSHEDLAAFKESSGKPRIQAKKSVELGRQFNDQLNEGLRRMEAVLTEAATVTQSVREALPSVEGITTGDLVNRFRTVMDNIQRDARDPAKGDSGVTLQSLDVEMKGFIALQQNEARIITPTLTRAADPGQLSIIRLAFGAIPVLRPEDDTNPPGEPIR